MRLALVEPRRLYREDDYERHIYRCGDCANTSRFVFELPSVALGMKHKDEHKDNGTGRARPPAPPRLRAGAASASVPRRMFGRPRRALSTRAPDQTGAGVEGNDDTQAGLS